MNLEDTMKQTQLNLEYYLYPKIHHRCEFNGVVVWVWVDENRLGQKCEVCKKEMKDDAV